MKPEQNEGDEGVRVRGMKEMKALWV